MVVKKGDLVDKFSRQYGQQFGELEGIIDYALCFNYLGGKVRVDVDIKKYSHPNLLTGIKSTFTAAGWRVEEVRDQAGGVWLEFS